MCPQLSIARLALLNVIVVGEFTGTTLSGLCLSRHMTSSIVIVRPRSPVTALSVFGWRHPRRMEAPGFRGALWGSKADGGVIVDVLYGLWKFLRLFDFVGQVANE